MVGDSHTIILTREGKIKIRIIRFKVERFQMKVVHAEAEMKVLPLIALYSRMNPVMGLSPSNPGVQTRENVLSLTSVNLTTGGSGSTERCSRRNKDLIKKYLI